MPLQQPLAPLSDTVGAEPGHSFLSVHRSPWQCQLQHERGRGRGAGDMPTCAQGVASSRVRLRLLQPFCAWGTNVTDPGRAKTGGGVLAHQPLTTPFQVVRSVQAPHAGGAQPLPGLRACIVRGLGPIKQQEHL